MLTIKGNYVIIILSSPLVGSIVVLSAVRALRVLLVDWTAGVLMFLRRAVGQTAVAASHDAAFSTMRRANLSSSGNEPSVK